MNTPKIPPAILLARTPSNAAVTSPGSQSDPSPQILTMLTNSSSKPKILDTQNKLQSEPIFKTLRTKPQITVLNQNPSSEPNAPSHKSLQFTLLTQRKLKLTTTINILESKYPKYYTNIPEEIHKKDEQNSEHFLTETFNQTDYVHVKTKNQEPDKNFNFDPKNSEEANQNYIEDASQKE